jgi:hypothetical protein
MLLRSVENKFDVSPVSRGSGMTVTEPDAMKSSLWFDGVARSADAINDASWLNADSNTVATEAQAGTVYRVSTICTNRLSPQRSVLIRR